MAKAKSPRGNAKASNGLPAGFTRIEGFAQSWDLEEMPVLQGTWGKERTIQIKRGKKMEEARVCDVETEDGKRYTVWNSAGLTALFDAAEQGTEVYIQFDGFGTAKKGQNAPKLFTVAYRS